MTTYNIESILGFGAYMAPVAADGVYWGTILAASSVLSDDGSTIWVTAPGLVDNYILTYVTDPVTGYTTFIDYFGYIGDVYVQSAEGVYATYTPGAVQSWLAGLTALTAPINLYNDTLMGNDYADLLRGGPGHDTVIGYGGADRLFGDSGFDDLYGGAGSDVISGGSGVDLIWGGLGKDTLTGGTQRDIFDFDSIKESSGASRDTIRDFVHGLDDIDLRTIDARSGVAGNNAFKFIGAQDFHHVKGELRFEKINPPGTSNDRTIIQGDVNGDGRADIQITLIGAKVLSGSDFLL